ncbi:MAG: SCO family protein [Planctomycetes bacterium]|nr:SCO family protein [Planctomycetota bacterium]
MTFKRNILIIAMLLASMNSSVRAQSQDPRLAADLDGVKIEQKLGAQIPLDTVFKDETGKEVKLGDYFNQGKPVVLNFVYFNCPQLCTLALNGALNTLKQLSYTPGKEFNFVTISFDPNDTPVLAGKKKANYIAALGKPEAAEGWHFLTGDPQNIQRATDAAGFKFKWVDAQGMFAHGAALFILTADGRLSRVLPGITYDPTTTRLSVVEAGGGSVGSVIDNAIMYCFAYDPAKGRYGPAAMKIMRLGAVLTVLVLVIAIVLYRWAEARRNRKTNSAHAPNPA